MRPMVMLLAGALVLTAAGCQPVNFETTVTLQPGMIHPVEISAPSRDQNIKVTVTATGAPVSVYVVLQNDQEAVKNAILSYKTPDAAKVLASQEKTENATLDAKIPSGNAYAVLVCSGAVKSPQVKISIKGG